MKVRAKKKTGINFKGNTLKTMIFGHIKSEIFSFAGLSLSLFLLITNTLTNSAVPAYETKYVDGIAMQSTTISTNFLIFTIGLIACCLVFLYLFLRKGKN